jgi:Tol biopolymer transport system component/exopolysaccharide biosynthesis protein
MSLVVAYAVVASALVGGAPAAPQAMAVNGEIVFVSGRTGTFRMFRIDPNDPGTVRAFAHGPAGSVDADPAWNPRPPVSVMAFSRNGAHDETYDLMVKHMGPVAATRITQDIGRASSDRQPAWNRDGSRIVFTRTVRAARTSNIWAVNPDGTGLTQLTFSRTGAYDASPAWSPDGSRIAFVSDRTGFPQIWTMDAAGGTQTQVTFGNCFVANPSWKPDDPNVIALEQLCPGSPTGWDLATLNMALSSPPTQLTATPENDHQPAWSPDGTQIAFTRYAPDGNKDLYTIPATGQATATPLTEGVPQADMSPHWGAGEPETPRAAPAGTARQSEQLVGIDLQNTSTPAASAAAKKKRKRTSRRVIKGVRFIQMRQARSDVYVLKVNPRRIPRIDVALAKNLLPGHERTRNMARRHEAVAAINGDFGTPSGRPSHTFAEDGDLKQVSFTVAPTFSMTQDERTAHFGRPSETVTADETDTWQVERWNFGEPGFTEISAFTAPGGTLEVPPTNACSVRLQAASGRRWAPGKAGVGVDFQVTEVGCVPQAFGLPAPGQVVLAAQPGSDGAILLNSLFLGKAVTLTWSIGFAGVLDTVGGLPLLVENGVQVVPRPCTTSLCRRHPRTGIGVTPAGRLLMVVVDGRRRDSKGVKLVRFARIMQGLRASFAMNLDGGGSSTMVVRGPRGGLKVVNEPSDGRQRRVSSAILVLKGADRGEVIGAPLPGAPAAAPARPQATTRAGELAAMDPGSTGGLAEAQAGGTFGPPVQLPPELRRALRVFRSSR